MKLVDDSVNPESFDYSRRLRDQLMMGAPLIERLWWNQLPWWEKLWRKLTGKTHAPAEVFDAFGPPVDTENW